MVQHYDYGVQATKRVWILPEGNYGVTCRACGEGKRRNEFAEWHVA